MAKTLIATPSSVDFGAVKIGETNTVDVVLTATGAPTISDATISGHADFQGGAANEDEYPIMVSAGKIWTESDTDLSTRRSFGCAKIGDYIYVVGGQRDDAVPTTYLNDCLRSIDGLVWETMSTACFASGGRSSLALFTLAGKLYAVGGSISGTITDEIWESENFGQTWTLIGNFPQKIARMGYAQNETTLAVYGGIDDAGSYSDIFSTSTDGVGWSQAGGQAPGIRADCTLAYVGSNGWMLFCGWDGSTAYDDCWKYIVPAFVDSGAAPFGSSPRFGVAGLVYGNYIFLHGGVHDTSETAFDGQEIIKSSGNGGISWSTLASTKTGRAFHAVATRQDGKFLIIAGKGWSDKQ